MVDTVREEESIGVYEEELNFLRPLLKRSIAKNNEPPPGRLPSIQKMKDYATGHQLVSSVGGKTARTYWRGRTPKDDDFSQIEKLAMEADQIGPCLARQRGGIVGRDFEWSAIIPAGTTDEEGNEKDLSADNENASAELKEVQAALSMWHKEARLHQAGKDVEYNKSWGGYSYFRVYVPEVYREMAEQGEFTTLEEALEIVHVHAVDRTEAGPVKDEHGRHVGAYYLFSEEDDNSVVTEYAELHGPQFTYILRKDSDEWQLDRDPDPNPLYNEKRLRRPRLRMIMARRDEGSCLSASILDKQDSLNEEYIYMKRGSSHYGGYRSIIVANAKAVTEIDDRTGKEKEIPWKLAPDVVVELEGADIVNNDGEIIGMATPTVTVIDPVDPKVFLEKIAEFKRDIKEDFEQTWISEENKAVSGESKRESRESWEKRIVLEAPPLVDALEEVLRTAKDIAGYLSNTYERYTEIDFSVRLYLDVTPGNLNLAIALIPAYANKLMSREAWIEINPAIPDGQREAEIDRLRKAEKEEIRTEARRAGAVSGVLPPLELTGVTD